jgi:branched-chain amino acid aminotransferase
MIGPGSEFAFVQPARPSARPERFDMAHPTSFTAGPVIWMDGALVPWDDAKIHVTSHVIHYGSGVFEGIRVYQGKRGSEVFRLQEHLQRLLGSARIFRMEHPHSLEDLTRICLETVAANGLPMLHPPDHLSGNVGVSDRCPGGQRRRWALPRRGGRRGIDVKISTGRVAPVPSRYLNGQMIRAILEGYSGDRPGRHRQRDGEKPFGRRRLGRRCCRRRSAASPPHHHHAGGSARHPVREVVPREMLWPTSSSSAARREVPIRSVDRITVGAGKRGPVTEKLQAAFFEIVKGEVPDRHGWLTPVPALAPALK